MFCHQCGTEAKAGARFCHACGKPLEVVQELPAASPAPTPTAPVTRPQKADTGLHPWRRFFARTIDLLLAVLLLVALYVILLLWLPNKAAQIVGALTNPITAAVIIYWLWVPVEAAFLATIGTTPAKWIFGIRVLKFDGRKLTFAEALKRAAFACILGDGLGIPGVTLFTRAYAYDRLKKTETTAWDMACGSVVHHSKWGAGRVIGATVVVLIAMVSSSILLTIGMTQEKSTAATPGQTNSDAPAPNHESSALATYAPPPVFQTPYVEPAPVAKPKPTVTPKSKPVQPKEPQEPKELVIAREKLNNLWRECERRYGSLDDCIKTPTWVLVEFAVADLNREKRIWEARQAK